MKDRTDSPKERRCVSTREVMEIKTMLRFVLSPDNVVTPDLKGSLPGRGMWVQSSKSALQNAIDKNMFSKSAKNQAIVPEDLLKRTEYLLRKRIVDTLSMGRRSGYAMAGFEKVKEMLKSHRAKVVFCAGDSTTDSAQKLAGMCRMIEVSYVTNIQPSELNKVFGNDKAIYASIAKCGIAKTLKFETDRLNLFLAGEK